MKILIIDDSKFARRGVLKHFTSIFNGEFTHFEADNGETALEIHKREEPELVFLDLTLPGIRGQDVLGNIKSSGIKSIVIVITADIQKKTKEEVVLLGADVVINKPITAEKLKEALNSLNTQ
ncbi:response regulator [Limisalsivibrio acetivorans]|uniref:response regulator n=1 Tax=Limisalsivibrio acetivorans TaxID=1304888 RepID=UPI0003B3DA16|nr:response regulator [Limisalsivibrio acetivorans]